MPRDQIFVSYSHHDRRWLDELTATLAPLLRKRNLIIWDDTKLRAGTKWKAEISAALDRAKIAVLLVSRSFLPSEFIWSTEWPSILEASEKEGLIVVWIAVGYSLYEQTAITDYQAANDPSRPLNSLSESEVDRAKTLDFLMSVPDIGSATSEKELAIDGDSDEESEPKIQAATGDASKEGLSESDEESNRRMPEEANERMVEESTGDAPSQGLFESDDDYQSRISQEANERIVEDLAGEAPSHSWFESDDSYRSRINREADELIVEHLTGAAPSQSFFESEEDYRERLIGVLRHNYWAWRSTRGLSEKAGVDEDTVLHMLKTDPNVELGRSKTGRFIARLKRSGKR